MNIENFCCAAAELQNKMTQTTKMSQIYYYRAFGEETGSDMLSEGFFNQAQDRVKVNDIIIAYYPDEGNNTLICWLKVTSNFGGKVTVDPFIADATLKAYVDSITPPLEDIFYATYGETTYSEITAALDDGKTVFCEYTVGQDIYDAVFVASQNGIYQFTHSIAYLDGGKITGNIQTFSVDTNNDWTTDSIYLQEKLVSGTNIKTVNNESLLGSGNIDVGTVKSVNNNQPDANGDVALSIPTVNNPTITLTQGGATKGSFTLNQASGDTIDLDAGGGFEIGDVGIALYIDETKNKRRYLNGQVISQTQFAEFATKIKSIIALYPALGTTEVNWQATVTNSDLGQCGQFVIDDVNGTIRLPKVVNINGLQNLAYLGEIKESGLPNITGGFDKHFVIMEDTGTVSGSGAFSTSESGTYNYHGWQQFTGLNVDVKFDASDSSTVYGNSTTVQQEAVQYPYFIQVANGVEENVDISTEIQLNNPFSLLDYKYSEYELDNASWLISNGQYNSGATYPAVYNLLLAIYNGTETKAGVSVKLSTEAYADTDFVLNTGDTTFRLPTKVLMASSKRVAGNGMTLGFTDGTTNYGFFANSQSSIAAGVYEYDKAVGITHTSSTYPNNISLGVTTDETKSGMETSSNGLYLYFYVGETIQDANIIAAASVLTDVADLKNATNFSDMGTSNIAGWAMPSDTYDVLTVGASGATYTAPANGWFFARHSATGSYGQCYVSKSDGTYASTSVAFDTSWVNIPVAPIPVKKGDSIVVEYFRSNVTVLRFIYAQGEI